MNIRAQIFGSGAESGSPVVRRKNPKGAKAYRLASVPLHRSERRRGNNRFHDRHRVTNEDARITRNEATCDVQLINVSGGGAMVSRGFEALPWDRVELQLANRRPIECAVLWLKDDHIGLEFAQEAKLDCSEDEQAGTVREIICRNFPDARFEAPAAPSAEVRCDERREGLRQPLICSGVLHYDYESTPAQLRNISATGALIETSAPLMSGAEPLLDFGEAGSVGARVTWVADHRAGLRFTSAFDWAQFAKVRPEIASADWEKQWTRMSANEPGEEPGDLAH